MDLKSMKRKELQALCKEHGIPANTTNSQMIESLSSILEVKVKPKGCLKGSGGNSGEEVGFLRGGSKKVTFVYQYEEKDEDDELYMIQVGKPKGKSIGRRSSVVSEAGKRNKDIEEDRSSQSSQNVSEVARRSTRSHGLAETVVWSLVIEKKKKKKKTSDDTEGVKGNAKVVSGKEKNDISGVVASTRSLRNRVVSGGDEQVVTDQKPRKIQKRKNSDKEENEVAAASIMEDEPVGKKNLRKRSRNEDTVQDKPPCRKSTRSQANLEETVATEEVDLGRANKRIKAVEKEIQNTNQGGNISDTAVIKKSQGRGRPRASKQGENEGLKSDGEDVAGPTRRSTHSTVSAVEKSDQDGEAGMKRKYQKQAKGCVLKEVDSASLLLGSEALPEPVRRSTRSSSAVMDDATSLPVTGKSVKGGKAVKNANSKKQVNDHGSDGECSKTSFVDTEAIAAPTRRSTRNSSFLLENGTSLPVGSQSVEEDEAIREGKSHKQVKARCSKRGVSTAGLSVNETITESARRSMHSSSGLSKNVAHLPAVGKLASFDEVIRNDTPGKKQGERDSKPEDSTTVHGARRSTRSSSKLSEYAILSPIVGKLSGQDNAVGKDNSEKQASGRATRQKDSSVSLPNSEAVITPTRRSAHSSSKLFEDEMPNTVAVTIPMSSKHSLSKSVEYDALRKIKVSGHDSEIKNNKSVKQSNNSESKLGDSTPPPPVPDKEAAVSTSTRRLTRSSSKLFGDGISLEVGILGIYSEDVNEDKSGRKSKNRASKQRGSTAAVLCRSVIPKSLRRPTQSSLNHNSLKVETSPSVTAKLDEDDESIQKSKSQVESVKRKKTGKEQRGDNLKGQGSAATSFGFKVAAQTEALEVFEQREEHSRRPTRSASKLDKSRAPVLFTPSSEISETKQRRKRMKVAASKEDMPVVESETVGGSVSREVMQASSTGSLRKSLRKVSADGEVVQGDSSSAPASILFEDEQNDPEVAQSPVNTQLQEIENDNSLRVAPKDLDDVCIDLQFKDKQSSFLEMTNKGGGALSSDYIDDSSKLQENVPRKVEPSNVALPAEKSHGYDKDKGSAPAKFISSTMKVSSMETSVDALDDVDNLTGMESQNTTGPVISLKYSEKPTAFHTKTSTMFQFNELNAKKEVHDEREDALRSNEATRVSSPQLPFQSSEELLLTSDAETSPGVNHEEPKSEEQIHDYTGDNLEGNETTDTGQTTVVDESSKRLSLISHADIHVEEPDSKVDGPSENVMAGSEATKIVGPVIANTENSSSALCDLNIEESDSKVEDNVIAKGGLENSEDTNAAGSHLSCKSTEVLSPSLLPTLFNEVCPDINVGEPCLKVDSHDMIKVASHSNAFLSETSHLHSETLKVARKIKALGDDTDSYSCKASLEVIKETWVFSTSTDTLNNEGHKNDCDNNGDGLKPSSPSESPALDPCSGQHLTEDISSSLPEEVDDGATALCSHGKEDSRHLTDQQGVGVNQLNFDVDSVDSSLKSTTKVHDNAEPLDVDIERSVEAGAVVEEGTENIESLESQAIIEEAKNNAMKNIEGIGQDYSDHFDEVGRELHKHNIGSHLSIEKSASIPGEENGVSLENFDSIHAENVLSKMDVILSDEQQLEEDNTDKAPAEKENPSSEELPFSVSFIPLPHQQESQESDVEKEVEVKTELSLSCNAIEGLFSALEPSEEERGHVSLLEPENNLEAAMTLEKQTSSSTPEGVSLVPADAFKCEDNNLKVVHTIVISEPGSKVADDIKIDDNVELRANSDYNTIIASCRTPDAKHGVNQSTDLSVCRMALHSEVTGIFETNESSPAADQSVVGSKDLSKSSNTRIVNDSGIKTHIKSDKNQGIPESFEHISNVEEAWAARGAHSMFVDDLFGMDNDGSVQVSQWRYHKENLSYEHGNFSEISIAEALELGDSKMKAEAVAGNSDAEREQTRPYECDMSPEAENFLSGSDKSSADMDSQAAYSAEQSRGQEERRVYIQETLEISRFTEDENADGLDATKIEGSAIRNFAFDQTETITMATVANQEELIASNCTELSGTNVADQVLFKGSSSVERRSIRNEFKDSTYWGPFSAQHSSVSQDTEAFRDNSTMHDESIANRDEIMAPEEYFEDLDQSFADFDDSNHEVREVNSQLPMESTRGKSPEHTISGFDMCQEQNKSSELDQIEGSKERVQSTPTQVVRNF